LPRPRTSSVWVDELTSAMLLEVTSKTHGTYNALIDAEDAERVSQHTWHVLGASSARIDFATKVRKPDGKRTTLPLHRFIMNAPDGMEVDHIHHNYCDLRKTELRCANNQQNGYNRRSNSNTTSRFKGVSWYKQTSKWLAQISQNGRSMYLGYFTGTPEGELEAALAYNAKAVELFGEYAHLNVIQEAA
jgi:hypothetical protein